MFQTARCPCWLLLVNFLAARAEPQPIAAVGQVQVRGGTLAVVLSTTNQIVIAIDSRFIMNKVDEGKQVLAAEDGEEKVQTLWPHLAFFVTGAGQFETIHATNSANETARSLAKEWQAGKKPLQMERFAMEFKIRTERDLSRLSAGDIYFLHARASRTAGSNTFNAVFVGRDWDSIFKVFRVTCVSVVDTNAQPIVARLVFDVREEKTDGRGSFLFYGASRVFERGMEDPKSPLNPAFRQLRASHALVAEPTAASLLDLAMREYGDGPDSVVGYPLFVYVLDAEGFRMTRKVNKGERIPFDSTQQGK